MTTDFIDKKIHILYQVRLTQFSEDGCHDTQLSYREEEHFILKDILTIDITTIEIFLLCVERTDVMDDYKNLTKEIIQYIDCFNINEEMLHGFYTQNHSDCELYEELCTIINYKL